MHPPLRDYYRLLGVNRDADKRAIKVAYRRLARKYHPDLARSQRAAQRFLEIQEAYEVLSGAAKRRAYDKLLHEQSAATKGTRDRGLVSDLVHIADELAHGLGIGISVDFRIRDLSADSVTRAQTLQTPMRWRTGTTSGQPDRRTEPAPKGPSGFSTARSRSSARRPSSSSSPPGPGATGSDAPHRTSREKSG